MRPCSCGHFVLFLHLCGRFSDFFFLIQLLQVWFNTCIWLYKLSATGILEEAERIMRGLWSHQSTWVGCLCNSSTEWDWAGGSRKNGLCWVALSWTFSDTLSHELFFFSQINLWQYHCPHFTHKDTKAESKWVIALIPALREQVVEPGSPQTISEIGWTRLGTDLGSLPFVKIIHLTSFLGADQAWLFQEVVMVLASSHMTTKTSSVVQRVWWW